MRDHMRRLMAGLALLSAAACADSTAPAKQPNETGEQKPQDQLTFLQLGLNTPGLAATTTTFWAKVGEDREVRLYYRPRAGRSDSTEYLRFRVRPRSLLKRPNGTAFATGDSIQITITVSDPVKLIVDFQPSGLQFDPSDPARLKLSFHEKSGDLNDDGKVDASDTTVKGKIAIWKQESSSLPWFQLTSVLLESSDEIEASITGFTTYAVAY